MKLFKLSRVILKSICLLLFLNSVASYVYTACAEEGDTCSSGYHAIECCDTSHECEQHWKYTYFKCVPQVRRDAHPRKKNRMPRKGPPKSIWDEEKTMYDPRPRLNLPKEMIEIIENAVLGKNKNSRNMHHSSGEVYNPYQMRPNNRFKKDVYHRHRAKSKRNFLRDRPPPEIHSKRGRNKRGNDGTTIMTFTI